MNNNIPNKMDPFWVESAKLTVEEIETRFPPKIAEALKSIKMNNVENLNLKVADIEKRFPSDIAEEFNARKEANITSKYTYFVSYAFNHGYGNIEVSADEFITKFSQVQDISSKIAKQNNLENIVILNYILLKS
jgi:hypothetical protein